MRKRDDIDRSERNSNLRHVGYMALPWVWLLLIGMDWVPGDQHSLFYRLSGLLQLVLLIGTTATSLWHGHELCVKCMTKVPLDGAKRAESGTWRLKLHHRGWKIIGAILAATLITGVVFDPTSVIPKIEWTVVDTFYAFLAFNSNRHDRLSFWCPWCKDGGDGDDEQVPDPQDNKDRPIPA